VFRPAGRKTTHRNGQVPRRRRQSTAFEWEAPPCRRRETAIGRSPRKSCQLVTDDRAYGVPTGEPRTQKGDFYLLYSLRVALVDVVCKHQQVVLLAVAVAHMRAEDALDPKAKPLEDRAAK